MADRVKLPNWPRLLTVDLAAAYLGVSETQFRALGICPLNVRKSVVYDRRSLDIFADKLAGVATFHIESPDLVDRINKFGGR